MIVAFNREIVRVAFRFADALVRDLVADVFRARTVVVVDASFKKSTTLIQWTLSL